MAQFAYFEEHLKASCEAKLALNRQASEVEKIIKIFCDTVEQRGRIYACGNGGSACDAMHFVEELVARYDAERPGIAAQHLLDVGTITCWANDYQYEDVFARQVKTLISEKDVLVLFSTSGNSENIIRAAKAAKERSIKTVAFLGKCGGKLKDLCDYKIVVESPNTAHIQEAHITLVHIFCSELEKRLFSVSV